MSTDALFVTVSEPVRVDPGKIKVVSTFLGKANQVCNEAWLLAEGGRNSNGALRVRLINEYGQALSDYAEIFSSSVARVKLLGVNIRPDGPFPPVVRVEALNLSTVENSAAYVHSLYLVYSS